MLGIANYVMKGPMQALIAVVLFSALSVFLAPFGILVGAIIALVTLRISVAEGVKTLVWGVVSILSITYLVSGSYFPALISIVEYTLPVFLMAVVLRKTQSLASALQFAMILVGSLLVIFHLMIADPTQWWMSQFNEHVVPLLQESKVEYSLEVIKSMADMVTMLLAVFIIILWFSILVVARWWQSELYNPGGFKADFYDLALPISVAYMAILLAIVGLINGTEPGLVYDLSGVLITGLMFQGLAIAHKTVAFNQMSVGWLVALYALLFFLPQVMLILATIGLVDIWIDFRSRLENEEQ